MNDGYFYLLFGGVGLVAVLALLTAGLYLARAQRPRPPRWLLGLLVAFALLCGHGAHELGGLVPSWVLGVGGAVCGLFALHAWWRSYNTDRAFALGLLGTIAALEAVIFVPDVLRSFQDKQARAEQASRDTAYVTGIETRLRTCRTADPTGGACDLEGRAAFAAHDDAAAVLFWTVASLRGVPMNEDYEKARERSGERRDEELLAPLRATLADELK